MRSSNPVDETIVFVLIATAIYDHGVVGVFATREEATEAAADLWRRSDGHHMFRIEGRKVGVTYDVYARHLHWTTERDHYEPCPAGDVQVEHIDESGVRIWAKAF